MPNSTDAGEKGFDVGDFISPNSSLTPGLAGALTTTITLTILHWLGDEQFPFVAIGISLLFALLVVMELRNVTKVARTVYLCLNTLVIFTVAAGAFINVHPPVGIDPEMKDQACQILDATPMDDVNRKFLKFLLVIRPKTSHPASLPSLLEPGAAYAQRPNDTPPAPGPGERPAVSPRPGNNPAITPQTTPELLKKAAKYAEDKERAKESQQQFILFPPK